ncbi:MAG TPA: hypothetical protein VGE29_10610 [Prosthecobacter sp.]
MNNEALSGREPPYKVGDVIEENGVALTVVSVRPTKGGGWLIEKSAKPQAQKKGFITLEQSCGFRIEHYPPPFVGRGTPRPPNLLKDTDWNFAILLTRPLSEKRVALFYELARESARIREACRLVWQKPDIVKEIADAHAKGDMQYEMRQEWGKAQWQQRQAYEDALQFLSNIEDRFPLGAGVIILDSIAKDQSWMTLVDETRQDILEIQANAEKTRTKHEGRRCRDVPASVPGWPFDNPIQFAEHSQGRSKAEYPNYAFNDGVPGRAVLASVGNGGDAGRILTESVEMCLCFNFRDEDIVDEFKRWLELKRASLHEEVKDFRESAKRPYVKLKSNNVDAALKGLAALRLRAAFAPLEAANKFDSIYFPKATARKVDIGNVEKQAQIAIDWQQMFFRYCPLDSAGPVNRDRGLWDRECSLCYKLNKLDREPRHKSVSYTSCRCSVCDHREKLAWNGRHWEPFDD